MGFGSKNARGITAAVLLTGIFFMAACGGSSEGDDAGADGGVVAGDTVSLSYKGTLNDGSEFSATQPGQPFTFVAGSGQVIPGFDEAVMGMKLNETKTFTIPDSLAYGKRNEAMMRKVPLSFFPEDMTPEAGLPIQLQDNQGRPFEATIFAVDEDSVTLDMNHRLAGEDLTFEIEVIDIK